MKRILWSSLLATICTTGLIGGLEPTAGASSAQTPPDSPPGQLWELPPRARSQIDALAAAKAARTPAQRKVESTLLTAAQLRRGRGMPGGAPVRSGVRVDASGRTTIDIRGTITSAVLDRVRSEGGFVRASSPTTARADLPLDSVESVASMSGVKRVVSFGATPLTGDLIGPFRPISRGQQVAQTKAKIAAGLAGASGCRRTP